MLSIKNVVKDRDHGAKQAKAGSVPICDHTVRGEGRVRTLTFCWEQGAHAEKPIGRVSREV